MATGFLTLLNACGLAVKSSVSSLDPDTINLFRKKFSGSILIPGESGYDLTRKAVAFNPLTDKFPSLIAQCKNQDDVLRCLELAQKYTLEVAVRSGNHSFLGWGTTDKGIVIDLTGLKRIEINPSKQTASVMTGCNAADILAASSAHGLAPVLGQCGAVGSGVLLGGGLGWLSAMYGASCDNLLSAQVITADGKSLRTDSMSNDDLFWSIRGGGGNFGIATQVEYKLHPVGEVVAGRLTYPISAGHEIFKIYKELMANAPDELQADFFLVSAGGGIVMLEVVYCGDLNKGDEIVNKIRKYRKPDVDEIKRRPFSEIYNMYKNAPEDAAAAYSSVKGMYVGVVSDDAFNLVFDRYQQAPPQSIAFFNFSHYMHGAVTRVASDATAFQLRNAGAAHIASMSTWNNPSDADVCLDWHMKTFQALQNFSGGRVYANYMSTREPKDGPAVYGGNFPKLVQLKKKYDPANFFHLNQNIDPNFQPSA